MDNYVIELRNKDFLKQIENQGASLQDGFTNGVWSNNLQEKLTLEEGDTLICRNSYIDTKAEAQQKIIINEDTELTAQFMYYANNWNNALRKYDAPNWGVDPESDKNVINPVSNTHVVKSDGEMYVACERTATGSNFEFLPSITYEGVFVVDSVGGFNVAVRFKGLNGEIQSKTFALPPYFEVGFGTTAKVQVDVVYDKTATDIPGQVGSPIAVFATNFTRQGGTSSGQIPDLTKRMDGTDLIIFDTKIKALSGAQALSGDVFHPKTSSKTVVLPKGNYDANELCEAVNSLFTEVGANEPTLQNLTQNSLLVSCGGVDENGDTPNADFNNFVPLMDKDSPTSNYGWKYTTNVRPPPANAKANLPNILGTSQFVLAFDPDTNRFSFQYLHTPIYAQPDLSDGGDALLGGLCSASGWTQQPSGTADPNLPTKRFFCSKNGGILLTGLSPPTFWQDQLGFDLNLFIKDQFGKDTSVPNPNCVLVSAQPKASNAAGDTYSLSGISATLPIFLTKPTDGTSMTGGFVGVNALFTKGNAFQKQVAVDSSPDTGETKGTLVQIGTATNDIRAGDGLLSAVNGRSQFGYFLIEVAAAFNNNYINQDSNFKHIMAIVSRYYDKNSYTSSTAGDSIIYQHKGFPVSINSFNCRILNSDKTLATNIGTDNTIILELVKASQQQKQIKAK